MLEKILNVFNSNTAISIENPIAAPSSTVKTFLEMSKVIPRLSKETVGKVQVLLGKNIHLTVGFTVLTVVGIPFCLIVIKTLKKFLELRQDNKKLTNVVTAYKQQIDKLKKANENLETRIKEATPENLQKLLEEEKNKINEELTKIADENAKKEEEYKRQIEKLKKEKNEMFDLSKKQMEEYQQKNLEICKKFETDLEKDMSEFQKKMEKEIENSKLEIDHYKQACAELPKEILESLPKPNTAKNADEYITALKCDVLLYPEKEVKISDYDVKSVKGVLSIEKLKEQIRKEFGRQSFKINNKECENIEELINTLEKSEHSDSLIPLCQQGLTVDILKILSPRYMNQDINFGFGQQKPVNENEKKHFYRNHIER